MSELSRHRAAGFALTALVYSVDQLFKWALFRFTNIHVPVEITPFFRLAYTENYGISLGLLTANSLEMRWLLLLATSLIAAGVTWWLLRERGRWDILALGAVLGGALGNITDRLTRGFVVDYADLHFGGFRPFLIFNVADAAISIGVVVILLLSIDADSGGTWWHKVRGWIARHLLKQTFDDVGSRIKGTD